MIVERRIFNDKVILEQYHSQNEIPEDYTVSPTEVDGKFLIYAGLYEPLSCTKDDVLKVEFTNT